jgi:hypothetical protein
MRAVIHTVRSDESGVASTLGTTMALLVFLTFLSMIVNQYVPAWMKESEAAHTNSVVGQFGALKGAIDIQILSAHSAYNAEKIYTPVTATTAVTLGVDGVPIFAAPTLSTMTALPTAGPFTVEFSYIIRGLLTRVAEVSNGSVEIDIRNRYFPPQRVVYENGAVIRYQTEGQVIRGAPIFTVAKRNNALDVSFGLVSLYGGGAVSGTNTEVITSQLFALDPQVYTNFPANEILWINHTSRYGLAWYQFLNETLANSLKLSGTFSKTALDVSFTGKKDAAIVYRIEARFNPTTQEYNMRLQIRDNPGVLPLSAFQLLHAQVHVQVGDSAVSP